MTNDGWDALAIGSVTVSAGSADFARGTAVPYAPAVACPSTPASLPAGQTCLLPIAFQPSASGTRSGQMVITSNSNLTPGTQTSIALTGTGVEPRLDVAPNPITFAGPGAQVLTLTSSGSMSVRVFSWLVTGTDAAVFRLGVPTCSTGAQLQPGAFLEQGTVCSVTLSFKPRRTGVHTAALEIQDINGLHSVPISGVGP